MSINPITDPTTDLPAPIAIPEAFATRHALLHRISGKKLALYCCGFLLALWICAPVYWMLITSIQTNADVLVKPPHWIPTRITIENYQLFVDPNYGNELLTASKPGDSRVYAYNTVKQTPRGLLNSFIVAIVVSCLNLTVASMGAYSFARYQLPFSTVMLVILLGTRMVPAFAIMIPIYQVMDFLKLIDTLPALIIAYSTFLLPFAIWILKSYFQTIPRDLEDAALVDGCGWPQMMRRVFLPVATPGLVATAIFCFLASWDEFLYALILTTSIASRTIPVVVSQLAIDQLFKDNGLMMTVGILAIIPPMIITFAFQRVIIRGLAAGAVKG